ncbi:hypothetical protein D2Q93_16640, partial [Alicyclobacillaceae bacterium I2511]
PSLSAADLVDLFLSDTPKRHPFAVMILTNYFRPPYLNTLIPLFAGQTKHCRQGHVGPDSRYA